MRKHFRTIFYFCACTATVILLTLFMMRELTTERILIFTGIILFLSVIGDLILVKLAQDVDETNEEMLELEAEEKTAESNRQFYLYASLQQRNIREFYHDLNSHIMTLKILDEKGQEEERNAYFLQLKKQYQDTIVKKETGSMMMDILCQYLLRNDNLRLEVISIVPENLDYEILYSVLHALATEFKK